MILIVTGPVPTKEIAEEIRKYFSYRGTACLIVDFEEAINQMHDSVAISYQQYCGLASLPVVGDVFSDPRDQELVALLRGWLEKSVSLCGLAKGRLGVVTKRWVDLSMYHVAVVYGTMTPEDVESFPESYRVYVNSQEGHPLRTHFNDCAVSNIFDLVVDTSKMRKEEMADLVGSSLNLKLLSALSKGKELPMQPSEL